MPDGSTGSPTLVGHDKNKNGYDKNKKCRSLVLRLLLYREKIIPFFQRCIQRAYILEKIYHCHLKGKLHLLIVGTRHHRFFR